MLCACWLVAYLLFRLLSWRFCLVCFGLWVLWCLVVSLCGVVLLVLRLFGCFGGCLVRLWFAVGFGWVVCFVWLVDALCLGGCLLFGCLICMYC